MYILNKTIYNLIKYQINIDCIIGININLVTHVISNNIDIILYNFVPFYLLTIFLYHVTLHSIHNA